MRTGESPGGEGPIPCDGTSWRELEQTVATSLDRHGVANAGREARWIVEEASGLSGSEWHGQSGERPTKLAAASVSRMLERRLTGEPLQYVLGSWQFRSLELFVDRRVLIPRPETEQVVEHALAELDRLAGAGAGAGADAGTSAGPGAQETRWSTVVDLGTGSGAIALSIASERARVSVHATDVSPAALEVARANLAGIGRHGARVSLYEGSWFDSLPDDLRGSVDVVVSNPPYVSQAEFAGLAAEVRDWEPESALVAGPTGLEAVERLLESASDWLVRGGALVLEIGEDQAAEVVDLAGRAGFAGAEVFDDLAGRPRVLVARS